MTVERVDYQRYLASREWAVLREQVRERSCGQCERCHSRPHQDTHHLTYERVGHEQLSDLLAVCRPCHEFLSGKRDRDPARQCVNLFFESRGGLHTVMQIKLVVAILVKYRHPEPDSEDACQVYCWTPAGPLIQYLMREWGSGSELGERTGGGGSEWSGAVIGPIRLTDELEDFLRVLLTDGNYIHAVD